MIAILDFTLSSFTSPLSSLPRSLEMSWRIITLRYNNELTSQGSAVSGEYIHVSKVVPGGRFVVCGTSRLSLFSHVLFRLLPCVFDAISSRKHKDYLVEFLRHGACKISTLDYGSAVASTCNSGLRDTPRRVSSFRAWVQLWRLPFGLLDHWTASRSGTRLADGTTSPYVTSVISLAKLKSPATNRPCR
jgi:hypothetical protein